MKIPLFPLEVVLFPEAALPLHIFEDRYKEMVRVCLAEKIGFGVVCAQREGLAVVGCVAEIVRILEQYPDGRLDILCQGANRFEIENLDNSRNFLQAEVDFFDDEGESATRSMREECTALHFEVLELTGGEKTQRSFDLDEPVAFRLAWASPADLSFRIELLAMRSDAERTARLIALYTAMLPKLRRGRARQQHRRAQRTHHVAGSARWCKVIHRDGSIFSAANSLQGANICLLLFPRLWVTYKAAKSSTKRALKSAA